MLWVLFGVRGSRTSAHGRVGPCTTRPVNTPRGRVVYLRTSSGWVCIAFVIDAFAGWILCWECSTSEYDDFVVRAVDHTVALRARLGNPLQGNTIRYPGAGSQYVYSALRGNFVAQRVSVIDRHGGTAGPPSLWSRSAMPPQRATPRQPWPCPRHPPPRWRSASRRPYGKCVRHPTASPSRSRPPVRRERTARRRRIRRAC